MLAKFFPKPAPSFVNGTKTGVSIFRKDSRKALLPLGFIHLYVNPDFSIVFFSDSLSVSLHRRRLSNGPGTAC